MATGTPKKIGKYDVLDVIGKGGMGIVYRAKDPFLDRLVAIKMMTISYAEYPDLLQRFYREAKSTANLKHPNIVTVYELGEHEGSPYLAMEFLEGSSMETILRAHQPLIYLRKIDIIVQVCHGLSYAHQQGIVHRDIKPGNIMVLKDGSVKIVDFGIARIGDTNFTRTGQFMGSLNYMSLEQLNDKLQVDQRTDVYSTGVVLFQFLTGVLPFEAESTGATLMKIINDSPPPFSKFLSSFPPELETITLKALAKDRDHRYSSADEFAIDLTQLQDRLKQESISVHMQQAEVLLQENDLFRANEELLEVLKIDKQHTRAASLLRTVRKQIEKEQSAERARHLKDQAEEAYRREEFESALSYLEQAINLDTTNIGLQQFRSSVQSAKSEAEHLRQALQRAENAHRAGNLDTAKQAIEEVLARRPDDTRVKSLYRMIQKDLEERLRQKRMESLLEAARKEIANRKYTAAFGILKEAEKLDPEAPQLRSLLEKFTTAREQEQRRKEVEQVTREIEHALNTDDHQSALNLVTEGLRRFPSEPSLMKLRDLAETQKEAAQTKSFVRERIAAAREILNAGNATGALRLLEDALRKAPGNPHLESLVSIAQERIAQDRDDQAKTRCIQQANSALSNREYAEAIQLLEAGQLRFAASPEIDNLLRFAREQQSKETKQQEIDGSVRRAQEFLRAQEYDRAIELLESIVARVPDDELRVVLEEARRRRDDLSRQVDAATAKGEQFLAEGSPAKALEFLQSQPTSFRRSNKFRNLLLRAAQQPVPPVRDVEIPRPEQELEAPEPAQTMMWDRMAPPEIERPVEPRISRAPLPAGPAPQKQPPKPVKFPRLTKQQKILAAGIVAGVLLIVIIVVIWPSTKTGTLDVRTNVDGVEVLVDGKSQGTVGSSHELKISLDEGRHRVGVQKPGYDEVQPRTVDIVRSQEMPVSFDLSSSPPPELGSGTLSIQTNVDNVDVFIDNDAKRVTKDKKLDIKLSAGDHEVRVDKQGYDQLPVKNVHVDKDEAARLSFSLTAVKASASFLEISSKPGARVSVDQKYRGTVGAGGMLRLQVEPSQHYVEVDSDDSFPWTQDISPKAGQTTQIIANLTVKPQPKQSAPAPTIRFTASLTSVQPGQSVQLNWQTTNATDVNIQGVGSVEASGTKLVTPAETTTYVLTAKGEGVTKTEQVTVTVAAAPPAKPSVASFAASSQKIEQGDSTTVTWRTTGASSVSIEGIGTNLPANGSQSVAPNQTVAYVLTAKGEGGSVTSEPLRIVVEAKPQPPPQPPGGSDVSAVREALARLEEAYRNETIPDMLQAWPSLDKKAQKDLQILFANANALRVKFQCDGDPVVTGNAATWNCVQSMTITQGGKRQPPRDNRVSVGFKKGNSGWVVDWVHGR